MATQKKGNFIIMNAAGSVVLAGRAAFVNSTPSAGVSDVSQIQDHEDSIGVIRTKTRNKTAYELTFTLTPGIGGTTGTPFANAAALKTAAELVPLGSTIVTTGFALDSLNWPSSYYALISSSSISASGGGPLSMSVTARRECSLEAGVETPVNFTGAWADL